VTPKPTADWELAVPAWGIERAEGEALQGLRKRLGHPAGPSLPGGFLKQADEQTLVGLSAAYCALGQLSLSPEQLAPWAVVGAPRFLGRSLLADALTRFRRDGAWGVSPHLPANACLHSLSGAVSVALKIHGPNIGVGGGPHSLTDGFLAAFALSDLNTLPGVLLVLTELDPEPATGADGRHLTPCTCSALCLALTRALDHAEGLTLRLNCTLPEPAVDASVVLEPRLGPLLAALQSLATAPAGSSFEWPLGGVGRLTWRRHGMPELQRSAA